MVDPLGFMTLTVASRGGRNRLQLIGSTSGHVFTSSANEVTVLFEERDSVATMQFIIVYQTGES